MPEASVNEKPAGAAFPAMVGPLVEPSPRWIRVKAGPVLVADSSRALLLREYGPGRLPTYYFPQQDVRMDLLHRTPDDSSADGQTRWTVNAGEMLVENGAWGYEDPPPDREGLRGHVTFAWDKGLAWFEEEEKVFVHARDPYKRVDVLRSSRAVKVVIGGETVAETSRPTLLFETSLPTRYYIPIEDVRMQFVEPSATTTHCPYKGVASYWSVRVGETFKRDVAWTYREPIRENPKIKDLVCFFNERVDLYVGGALQVRPRTPWTRE